MPTLMTHMASLNPPSPIQEAASRRVVQSHRPTRTEEDLQGAAGNSEHFPFVHIETDEPMQAQG